MTKPETLELLGQSITIMCENEKFNLSKEEKFTVLQALTAAHNLLCPTWNKSKYKGVFSSHRIRKPWRAQIDNQHLGVFETEEQAAFAYNEAAIGKYGINARLNNINSPK